MIKQVRNLIPRNIKAYIKSKFHERYLVEEIHALNIDSTGVERDVPWVRLQEGVVFYGFLPTSSEIDLYHALRSEIPHIPLECFSIVMEIINRYKMPRCLPGESVRSPSRYRPLRDPLNDFNDLSVEEKELIAQQFKPPPGSVIVDIGAFLGYGTLQLSKLVGSNGKVIAFESDPVNLSLFNLNTTQNNASNITIIDKAVTGFTGEAEFSVGGKTVNSLKRGTLEHLGYKSLDQITVDTTTVDHALQALSIQKVDLVNITINGGEYDALLGMKNIIQNSESIKITLAGWYRLPNGQMVCDLTESFLRSLGLKVIKGKLGRVLAWKED